VNSAAPPGTQSCAAAIRHLNDASPADDTEKWLGAWLLLRKVRRASLEGAAIGTFCTGVIILAGFIAFEAPTFGARNEGMSPGFQIACAIAGPIGASAAALTYYLFARTALGPTYSVPLLRDIAGVHNAMAPFDGIAKEHLRKWSESRYAS
jgi:hypothetical protein